MKQTNQTDIWEHAPVSWMPPAILLLLLSVCFLWFLSYSASELPERVATHFGFGGKPDGWMSRAGAIAFMRAMGFGLPLFIVAVAAMIRFLPSSVVNIPNREYWLAPERRARTSSLMFRQMLWLACLIVCFMMAMHYLTVRANQTVPARMPTDSLAAVLVGFLVCLGIWVVALARTFSKGAMNREREIRSRSGE